MCLYKLTVPILILWVLTKPGYGQFSYNTRCAEAHDAILSLNFGKSDQLLATNNNPENGIIHWLTAYQSFLKELTSTNDSTRTNLNTISHEISRLKTFDKASPYYYFCLADATLFRMYIEFQQHNYVDALTDYIKVTRYLEKNQELFPQFEPGHRQYLIKLVADANVTDKIPIIPSRFTFNETENIYHQTVNHLVNSDDLQPAFKRETKLLAVLLNSFLTSQAENPFELAGSFGSDWPNQGPLENYVFSESAIKAGKNTLALHELKNGAHLHFFDSFNLLNLIYGNEQLNQLNDSAIIYLSTFCKKQTNQKRSNYAHLKMGWYYLQKNQLAKVDSIVRAVNQTIIQTSEDQQAAYEFRHYRNWNQELLKSRLYFDGGNYQKSLDELLNNRGKIEQYTKDQRLEYAYRLGRAYQKLEEWDKALIFYQMAITSELDHEYYYPVYSAYYSGQIYQHLNEPNKAIHNFKLCFDLDTPVYKESIQQKANTEIRICNRK